MKLFKSNGIIGKAGEFYFAYWIVHNFRWPCRILDIDVGMDAQVEVFEDEISTGHFFAVQIKSTTGRSPKIQIDLADFKYWLQIENNVILASVVFSKKTSEPDIYWKYFSQDELNLIINNAERKKKKSKLITFSNCEKLQSGSKAAWLSTLYSELDKDLIRIAKSLIKNIEENYLFTQDYSGEGKDSVALSQEINLVNSLFLDYEKLNDAVLYDRCLIIRAKLIDVAIKKFKENKMNLLFIFDYVFEQMKPDRDLKEFLPEELSRTIKSKVDGL